MDIAARVNQDPGFSSRYELKEVLGTGGMGVVHRATHRQLGRPVAIKFMREELLADQSLKHRFLEEARAAASILHPNVTAVLDAGFAGDIPFLVTELVPGEPLSRLLTLRRWPPAEVMEVIRQVVQGLEAIHRLGIVHRDIKPTNLLVHLGPPLAVKILDFGLAKRKEGGGPATISGLVLGTPAYMAPEQALQDPVSAATDLYAVTVVLYELITGQTPFTAPTVMEMVHKHLHDPPPIPEGLPGSLRELLVRGLSKQPGQRYASGEEYRTALARATAAVESSNGFFTGQSLTPIPHVEWGKSVLEHLTLPNLVAPAAKQSEFAPLAALWGLEPPAFAKAFRDYTLVQPNLRQMLKELARMVARNSDISTPEKARGAWSALGALATVTAGHSLAAVKLRGRAVAVATWLATRTCTLVPGAGAPAAPRWEGGAALTAAIEARDAAAATAHMRAGLADRASLKEAQGALLTAYAADLGAEGEPFTVAARVVELLASGAWAGAEEALVVAAAACGTQPRDAAPAQALTPWFTKHRELFANLAREAGDPDGPLLATMEDGLREGGQAGLDAILWVARKQGGWKPVWECMLLALARLMFRTGPQSGALAARAFAYLTAVRQNAAGIRGDRRFLAPLLAAPLLTRALKSVATEPASPVQRGTPSLDAALDQGDPETARAKVTEALGSVRETPALESLGRAAACNAEAAGYVARLSFAIAAIPAWQESTIPGRERYLQALATVLSRAPRELDLAAELQRAGL